MEIFFAISMVFVAILGLYTAAFIVLSLVSKVRAKKKMRGYDPSFSPLVSVIVPSYNEDVTIYNCVSSLLTQTYSRIEIILVNDGSLDNTGIINRDLARMHPNVIAYDKPNGGKASALNYGIKRAKGEVVICIDADSVFAPDAVELLVAPFSDPAVDVVGGNVKVVNRGTLLTHLQAAEYVYGLTIQRQAFSLLSCIQVIPGPIGPFRKSALEEVGYYPEDTLVEDMDMTMALSRAGKKVVYNPRAIAYTEAPEKLGAFFNQRLRWMYGTLQVVFKRRDMLFNPRYKTMGIIGLPYMFFFPLIDLFQNAMVIVTLSIYAAMGELHNLVAFYVVMVSLRSALVLYAVISERESVRLVLFAGVSNLVYNWIINIVMIKAVFDYARKANVGWKKLERMGKNVITDTA